MFTHSLIILQVIYREEVDLPDELDIQGLDYPPRIKVEAKKLSTHPNSSNLSCEVKVLGLKRAISLKMELGSPIVQQEVASPHDRRFHSFSHYPLSPSIMSDGYVPSERAYSESRMESYSYNNYIEHYRNPLILKLLCLTILHFP